MYSSKKLSRQERINNNMLKINRFFKKKYKKVLKFFGIGIEDKWKDKTW